MSVHPHVSRPKVLIGFKQNLVFGVYNKGKLK